MTAIARRWSLATFLLIVAAALQAAPAQVSAAETAEEIKARKARELNKGRVGIISGGVTGTYVRIASDLANVLDKGYELRVIAMLGKGSVQNIEDILYLKGVDIGIVQSDVLTHLLQSGEYPNIKQRIHYITKLYNEEFHLLGLKRHQSVVDLNGKRVNVGRRGSGTQMTAKILFQILGVSVIATNYDQEVALQKMANGELDASVYVVGKPASDFRKKGKSIGRFAHFIPIDQKQELLNVYSPTTFEHSDYPDIVAQGETVRTVAVGAIMAVYNWPAGHERYGKVKRFIDAFIDNLEEFKKEPRHKKWREVDLSVEVPGWNRYAPVEARLQTAGSFSEPRTKKLNLVEEFEIYLKKSGKFQNVENISEEKKKQFFDEFIKYMGEKN